MNTRNEINEAWGNGYKAGKEGKSRASNPHVSQSSELAKSWDDGWQEGAGKT